MQVKESARYHKQQTTRTRQNKNSSTNQLTHTMQTTHTQANTQTHERSQPTSEFTQQAHTHTITQKAHYKWYQKSDKPKQTKKNFFHFMVEIKFFFLEEW
jgi:hypothetical protein